MERHEKLLEALENVNNDKKMVIKKVIEDLWFINYAHETISDVLQHFVDCHEVENTRS